MIKTTKEEFLDRVRTSESTLQEAFTNEAIKAIYTTLHSHAINALAKNNSVSNVDNLLSGWTEYENVSQMWQSNPQFSDLKQAKEYGYHQVFFDGGLIFGQ